MPTKLLDKSVVTASVILLLSTPAGCSRVVQIAEISAIASAAGTAITIVAIQNATERQSQVALQQGRFAYGQIKAKQMHIKQSRYIAVATVREPTSKGAKSLMIYDTETDQVVGNHVYDIEKEPKTGQTGKFETISAEYVGTGQY
jgi:hypothetical protein